MRYTVTIEIDAPLGEVVRLFDAPDNWSRWRDGFMRSEWRLESDVRCSGLLKVLSILMPAMFRDATLKEMRNFKAFVEDGAGST